MDRLSEGTLLGGRVIYRQFTTGHRSGFEPVLLAAAVPARPGELVLEAGTGAGAGLLCLAARVPGLRGYGLELHPAMTALAKENFRINDFSELHAVQGSATAPPFATVFDHVLANPPWHDAAGTASPDAPRALAHQAKPGLLQRWIAALAQVLKPRGSITLILPAASFAPAAAALAEAGCGGITLLPLWPHHGEPAKQVLITARRGSRQPSAVMPGLTLHEADGITPAAQHILRDGAALSWHGKR